MKTILDPSFKYTPSFQTDVRKTFDRIRREREEQIRPAAPVTQLIGPALLSRPARRYAASV
jgi:hypothetical protein